MTDISTWLLGVYDRREKVAWAATPGPWFPVFRVAHVVIRADGEPIAKHMTWGDALHMHDQDPTKTLADIAAKKAIVEQCIAFLTWDDNVETAVDLATDVLKHLASAHADRPGYRQEWAVE